MNLNLAFSSRWALVAVLLVAAATRFIDLDVTPPGLWYDEGLNGLFARDVAAGDWRLFYGDREGLFFYPLALAVTLFGESVLALRWLAAAVGVVTVAALAAVGKRLFGAPAGLIAAAGLSVSFWHIAANRMAERVNLLPLFELLTVACLWRAIYPRSGAPSFRWAALTGALVGLTLYTYLASRFFPFVLILFVLWQAVYERDRLVAVGRHWAVVCGAAAIVFAPLAVHYWRFPNDFILRSSQVWPYAGLSPVELVGALLRAFVDTVGLFAIQGDQNWRHNLPGRAAFDIVAAGALFVGIVRTVLRLRRAATALCLIWLVVMLLPSALAADNPHFLRAFGAIPAAWLLAAHGGLYLAANLATTGLGRDGAIIAGVLWFGYAAATNTGAYFVTWRERPETAVAYEAGVVDGARVLNALPTTAPIVASAWIQPHPSVTYLLAPGRTVTWFAGRDGLALPAGGALVALFGPAETAEPILRDLAPPVAVGARRSPLGDPLFRLYQTPADVALRPAVPSRLAFDTIAALDGVDITARRADSQWVVAPGQSLAVRLSARILRAVDRADYAFSLQLRDPTTGRGIAQDDSAPLSSDRWRGGERLVASYGLDVPADTPPGLYDLVVVLYARDGPIVSVRDADGAPVGDAALVARVRVANAESVSRSPTLAEFGPITLVAADSSGVICPNRWCTGVVTLEWRANAPIAHEYRVFVHLADPLGRPIAQSDGVPAQGRLPTSAWLVGERIVDRHRIVVPAPLGDAPLRALVGLYDPVTGQRLLLPDGSSSVAITPAR